jgi:hypothetical protein
MAQLESVRFDYTDKHGTSRHLTNEIGDLAEVAKTIQEFREELTTRCEGKPLSKLQKEWADYREVFLGGVENGQHTERGLAKAYKDIFGVQLESVADAVQKQSRGLDTDTPVQVEETEFSAFVSELTERVTKISEMASESDIHSSKPQAEYDFYDTLSNPKRMTDMVRNLVSKAQRVLPNYSQRALFVWTLDMTPHGYLERAYPKLKDNPEAWEYLKEFGLEPVFVPDVSEEDPNSDRIRDNYTMYSYRDGSIGRELVDLYLFIWESFSESELRRELRTVFSELPDFKQEYISNSEESLRKIGWESPDIRTAGEDPKYSAERGDTKTARYTVDGTVLSSLYYRGYSTSKKLRSSEEEKDISLLRTLDDLSPALFLLHGLGYELSVDEESLELTEL